MTLLISLPLEAFLAVKQLTGFAITAGAVFLTISPSLTTAVAKGVAYLPGQPLGDPSPSPTTDRSLTTDRSPTPAAQTPTPLEPG